MSSSQECLGMNRPHKTVEYDLDTVLSKENKPNLTVMSATGIGYRAKQICKWSGIQLNKARHGNSMESA
jgi:hypothetical protein